MRTLLVLCCLALVGCAAKEPPLPPVPPPAEDLSTWGLPEVVQPPEDLPPVVEDKPTIHEKVYAFSAGTRFEVVVQVGTPLDIMLAPGEQVRSLFGDGLSTPSAAPETTSESQTAGGTEAPRKKLWTILEGAGGQRGLARPSIFMTAALPGLTYGLIVKTDQRSYYLVCKSVKRSPVQVVRWTYADMPKPLKAEKEPGLLPDPQRPKRWHVGYQSTSPRPQFPDWAPRAVVDDGRKMYLVLPEVALFATVPMVRMIGPNGPALVNARQFLNVLIVDQLAPRLELRIGLGETAEVVTITRGNLRTIECPGADECPVFPQAAFAAAGRARP
jgi:type IV secretory pathway VirB9-like protein